MSLTHISTRRIAPRLLAAYRLEENLGASEHERLAASRLRDVLSAHGLSAHRLVITDDPSVRLSNDGLLMQGNDLFVPSLVAVALGEVFGFAREGGSFERHGDTWTMWIVGPSSDVLDLRYAFATAMFLLSFAYWRHTETSLVRPDEAHLTGFVLLAIAIGLIAGLGNKVREAEKYERAIVLWAPPPEDPNAHLRERISMDGVPGSAGRPPRSEPEAKASLDSVQKAGGLLRAEMERGHRLAVAVHRMRRSRAPVPRKVNPFMALFEQFATAQTPMIRWSPPPTSRWRSG